MRRLLPIVSALLVLALAGTARAATAPAVPNLGVKVVSCQSGAQADQRAAAFSGAMPRVAGASELAMRFELEQRRGATWRRVSPAPFAGYERSAPGAAGFVYVKRVQGLAPEASYRVAVHFKWMRANGAVRKRAVRHSAPCRQPDVRPDLAVTGVTAEAPTADGRVRYLVQLLNLGFGDVLGTLRVGLAVDGTPLPETTLSGLRAGQEATVAFQGPPCPVAGSLTATVDLGAEVEEGDQADNRLVVPCP